MGTAVASSPHRITIEDLHEEKGPLWINNQATPVGVYTPTGKKLYVLPWKDRPRPQAAKPIPSDNPQHVYCVRGMHYNAFTGPAGPLTVFLDRSRAIPAGATAVSVDALRAAAASASRHQVAAVNPPGGPDLNSLYDETGADRADAAAGAPAADGAVAGEQAPASDAATSEAVTGDAEQDDGEDGEKEDGAKDQAPAPAAPAKGPVRRLPRPGHAK